MSRCDPALRFAAKWDRIGPMSVAVRIIACLDVHDGRVVKGVNFQ